MAVAPAGHVVPIDPVPLDGDDVLSVVQVFATAAGMRPAEFRDNHVLRRWNRHVPFEDSLAAAAGKAFVVVRIVAQQEQLDYEGALARRST